MGTMRAIHFWAAMVFGIAVPSRLLWMVVSNNWFARWHQFLPVTRTRLEQMWGTLLFYLFLRRKPPEYMPGHNPLAGAAYLAVYGLEGLMILTGLALYGMFATDGPLAAFAGLLPLFGGAQMARWLHHIIMWLLIGFFAHHFYSALLTSIVEKNGTLESIFSGWKWFRTPRERQ
jgi:Ni/Fe-hydrogenase 1 B-type cytochrome subunit